MRSSGRVRTCFAVSISQPRMTFFLLQAASPLRSFLREMGSFHAISSLSFGRKSSSMAQKSSSMARKRCRVICCLSFAPPWVIPMKSSRYTSTCARAVARACGDSASHSLSVAHVASASSSVVSGGFISARFSRWWGSAVWRVESVSRARSLMVSVVAQKKAADYTYPMVMERWNPLS